MLRCLQEQHVSPTPIVPAAPLNAAKTATKRLNQGYSSLLASGVSARPSLALFPPESTNSSAPSASALSLMLADPSVGTPNPTESPHPTKLLSTVRSSQSNNALNSATVELEHQKFIEEPVISATEMEGLSPIDYWLVSTSHIDFIRNLR